jgi:hypothetical protein
MTTNSKLATIALALALTASCAPANSRPVSAPAPVAGCFEPVRPARFEDGCSEGTATPPLARSKMFHHLRYHQSFPVAKSALLASLAHSAEISAEEARWIAAGLTDRVFSSGADVLGNLFPSAPAAALAQLATLAQR